MNNLPNITILFIMTYVQGVVYVKVHVLHMLLK